MWELKAGTPGHRGLVRTSALPLGGLEQVACGLSFLTGDTEPAVASAQQSHLCALNDLILLKSYERSLAPNEPYARKERRNIWKLPG